MFRLLPLLFLLLFHAAAAPRALTIDAISQMPEGRIKDFYIWRFLNRNISAAEADAAFGQIHRVTWKHIHRYARKTRRPGFAMADRCHRLQARNLPAADAACSAIAITPYKFATLTPRRRRALIRQLRHYPDLLKWMRIMNRPKPFLALVKTDAETFCTVFNGCGETWRRKYLNHPLPPRLLRKLAQHPAFTTVVKKIVTDPTLKSLQQSLLEVPTDGLRHTTLFFLGLNALRLNHPTLARYYLAKSYKKAWFRFDRDKVLFWFYQIDGKEAFLNDLVASFDLNIYTLYAREKKHLPLPAVVSPRFQKDHCGIDIHDPFAWRNVLETIRGQSPDFLRRYARTFECADTLGHYAFLMERASRSHTHYFPMPYPEAFKNTSLEDQAVLLALARQESRFIPASVSSSYALGMMQIMPFLVKALAKQRGEPFDLDKMFDPVVNVAYAHDQLRFLQRYLHHPLFIAYAYNGGIGFTRRLLKKRHMFHEGKYEPWLSMELVPYDESRRYGKKVLANWIIYRKLLGKPVTLASAVETSIRSSRTGRSRTQAATASHRSAGK